MHKEGQLGTRFEFNPLKVTRPETPPKWARAHRIKIEEYVPLARL